MRIANRGGYCLLPPLLLFLLWVGTASVFGAGSGDRSGEFDPALEMKKAVDYIEKGRLDDAIIVLVEIARRDPEQMERVQSLVLDIREFKALVNDKFDELNRAIAEGNEDRADELIREIKGIDTAPNRNTLNNLILAAIVVGKAKNDSIRNEYFTRGNARLEQSEYREAVSIYRTGFISDRYLEFYDDYIALAADRGEITKYLDDLDRQEKIWNAYGTIGPEGNRIIEEINAALDTWDNNAANLNSAALPAIERVRTDPPAAWTVSLTPLVEALRISATDIVTSSELSAELADIQRRLNDALDGIPEDFRYERIVQFITGRPEAEQDEGVRVAQLELWQTTFETPLSIITDRIEESLTSGQRFYRGGLWDDADLAFSFAEEAADSAIAFSEEVGQPLDQIPVSTSYFQYARAAAPFWKNLVSLGREIPTLPDFTVNEPTLELVNRLEDPILNGAQQVADLTQEWNETESRLSDQPGATEAMSVAVNRELRSDLSRALNDYEQRRLVLLASAVGFLFENLERDTRAAMEFRPDEAQILIEGRLPSGETEGAIPERKPSLALDTLIRPAVARLGESEDDVRTFIELLQSLLGRTPTVENAEEVEQYLRRGENLLVDVAEYSVGLQNLEDEAQQYINNARRAETTANNALVEARQNLRNAQNAVTQGQNTNQIDFFYRAIDLYNAVEASLDRVDTQYLNVLINDADIAAASGIQDARSELRNQAQADRNRLAVTVKQNAVDEARRSYEDGRYASGIGVLNQAQGFWNSAYGDDDAELDGWLLRLRNAQQALQQTVIEKADPLYVEMNQYLNLANRYYNDGVRVASGNPRNADAVQAFRAAGDLVRQVLNTFPGNEAALLLEQKILRQTDEDQWTQAAQALVAQSRRALSSNDVQTLRGTDRQKGLYAQLKVLQSIDSGFPNLQQTIYDAEVALGIIIPEPDPAILAESRQLTGQARQIWDNLGRTGADRALELLDNALGLWLDNVTASRLKNEILLSTEPERLPALPAELLNLLAFVEDYYSQGNYILAKAFIDRAVNDYPRYANDPRIRELKRKVESRL